MKIVKLRFKNLNSLYGEWELDFSHPDYSTDGIFAITGPTGSGKSTIMDAICLALYGRTPRLPRLSQNSNEIMSRQSGECFSELTFSSKNGIFRCTWSQHRAYKKPDGKLAPPKHELVDESTNKVIESTLSGVAKAIVEHTGMDFDRFTRSMLLAQGGFAAFLQASPAERAPLLEEITGSEIFSQISIRVQNRQALEKKKCDDLSAQASGIVLLGEEDLKQLAQQTQELAQIKAELSEQQKVQQNTVNWLEKSAQLSGEIAQIEAQIVAAQQKITDFKPFQAKLNLALKAVELETDYQQLRDLRRNKLDTQKKLAEKQSSLEKTSIELQKTQHRLEVATQNLVTAQNNFNQLKPLLKETRELDQKITALQDNKSATANENNKLKKQITNNQTRIADLSEQINALHKKFQTAATYLQQNSLDADLVGNFSAISQQVTNLDPISEKISTLQKKLEKSEKEEKKLAKQEEKARSELEKSKEKHAQLQNRISTENEKLEGLLAGKLLREYRNERDSLVQKMILMQRIRDLEEERSRLKDGEPCPLCGATEHPYAQGNIPDADENEQKLAQLEKLLQKGEKLEEEISGLKSEAIASLAMITQAEKQLAEAEGKTLMGREKAIETGKELESWQNEQKSRQQELLVSLQAYGISELPENGINQAIEILQKRRNLWLNNQTEHDSARTQLETKKAQKDEVEQSTAELQKSLQAKELQHENLIREISALAEKRRQLFADKLPDEEECLGEKLVEIALNEEKQQRKIHEDLDRRQNENKVLIKSLLESLQETEKNLDCAESKFMASLARLEFSNETSFIAAAIERDERNRLHKLAEELESELKELQTRLKDRSEAREVLTRQNLSDQPVEFHKQLLQEVSQQLDDCLVKIGALKQRRQENEKAAARLAEKREMIEAQQKEFERWDRLYRLIGSADGKKYQKFAQGLTFDLLIKQANLQLAKLSDRYLLVHDRDRSLELDVIDNYQAGEIRSSKNLSGGESFLISLALALGLSAMASRKLSVDSLFLDEGFGTLDEEALETALTTLSSLQREGKMIGIISHVTLLKDRIPNQIQVEAKDFGRSVILGNGVRKIS